MKRLLLYLLLLILAVAAALYLNPVWREQAEDLVEGTPLKPDSSRLYKWLDDKGQWQVSDTPPPPGVKYEILKYRHDVNVLPPLKAGNGN